MISDPRVRHYWNDDIIAGKFFKEHDFGRTVWDIYFLYGPEPLLLSGRTVNRRRQALQDALLELWQEMTAGQVNHDRLRAERPGDRSLTSFSRSLHS